MWDPLYSWGVGQEVPSGSHGSGAKGGAGILDVLKKKLSCIKCIKHQKNAV